MKIRTGFVSNSSSSSFCIYGVEINFYEKVEDDAEFSENLQTVINERFGDKKLEALFKKSVSSDVFDNCDDDPIICTVSHEQCCLVIGRSYLSLGESETGSEFKESATKIVSHILKELNKSEFEFDNTQLEKLIITIES